MSKKNYQLLSLSELSLLALNSENPDLLATEEIKRRFKNNGCDYDIFAMEEQEVINKRGEDSNKYLISSWVTAQQVMETYFNNVYGLTSPNTLFSEVHLCNNDPRGTFFDRVLALEINNLNRRINILSQTDKCEKLKLVREILQNQRVRNGLWYENAGTDAVYDLCQCEFGSSEKWNEKMESLCERVKAGSKIDVFKLYAIYPYILLKDSDFSSYLGVHKFLMEDSMRLNLQKARIFDDLKYGHPIDYSFVEMETLNKKKQKNI